MAKFIVAIETVKIKEFLFSTNKLKVIRGASYLLDYLNQVEVPKILDRNGITEENIIYVGAGNAKFFTDTKEKAEKIIVGTANKNLFKNENEIPLNENNNNKLTENFILFKVKNYTYLISFYNNYGVKENSYTLTVAKNDEEILFDKELDISTVYDNLFNTNFFKKLPYDNGVVAYYITYD